MKFEEYTVSQLAEWRGAVRMNVAKLERLGAMRTLEQDFELREQRQLMKNLTREIKARIVQLPLL